MEADHPPTADDAGSAQPKSSSLGPRPGGDKPAGATATAPAAAGQKGSTPAASAAAAARPGTDPDLPGADLPPVIAPPGRTRGNARARNQTGSLSRPSSIHVDDFQRGVVPKPGQHKPELGQDGGGPGLPTPRGSGGLQPRGSGGGVGGPTLPQLLSDPAVVAVSYLLPLPF